MRTHTPHKRERRNALIRTIAALTGDIATGLAFAALCTWLINAAALGVFLSFLLWLISALLCLAVSQYLIHPSVKFLLSDHKLEATLATASGLYEAVSFLGEQGKIGRASCRERV